MGGNAIQTADIMTRLGSGLLVFILVAIFILLAVVVYIVYVEKKNSSWLNQRQSAIKAVYSLKSAPFLYCKCLIRVNIMDYILYHFWYLTWIF